MVVCWCMAVSLNGCVLVHGCVLVNGCVFEYVCLYDCVCWSMEDGCDSWCTVVR